MIAQSFDYSRPRDLKEALDVLASGGRPLAGGMSLIPMMKLRLATPELLVDLSRIEGLNRISEQDDELHIGAMTTHFQIESSPVVRAHCPLLAETARHIGDVQVRNMGTIGGSVAHADPAADYPAALLALEAKVRLAGSNGERTLPLEEFLLDTFTTALEPGEIITEVIVPVDHPLGGTAYQKLVQPASGFAIVGVAARVRRSNGRIATARIGVTGVASSAYRAVNVENALTGTAGSEEDIRGAVEGIAEGRSVNSDIHASAEYRRAMARVYASRAIASALSRGA